jgi:hypothetical protein
MLTLHTSVNEHLLGNALKWKLFHTKNVILFMNFLLKVRSSV